MSDLKGLVGKEQTPIEKYIKGLYLHDLQKAGCAIDPYTERIPEDFTIFLDSETFFCTDDRIDVCLIVGDILADVEVPEGITVNCYSHSWAENRGADQVRLKNIRTIFEPDVIDEFANNERLMNIVLNRAVIYGYLETVKICIEDKNVNFCTDDDEALYLAVNYDHLDIVKYLVDQGADIHAREDDFFIRAAEEDKQDCFDFLMRCNREPELTLQKAKECKSIKTIEAIHRYEQKQSKERTSL